MRRFFVAATAFAMTAIGLAADLATPAQAGTSIIIEEGWGGGWHHHPHYRPYYAYGAPVYVPPPVYYVAPPPPPVVVAPPPAVVYQAPPPPPMVVDATPVAPAYTTPQGQTCREYQTTVRIGNMMQPSYGTACLQPDGSWRIVK